MMDAETRRARMRKMCQTCKLETTQAGSATRSQRSIHALLLKMSEMRDWL